MFILNDNLTLQLVNLYNFKLCHPHYQSTIFNDGVLVHKLFLHYLSTSPTLSSIYIVSYHFNFLCCSKCNHIKNNNEKGRRLNFSVVMIKHIPFSHQTRKDITCAFCFHSNKEEQLGQKD